jgi:hypothetical protein
MSDIQRADPAARRRVLWLLVMGSAIGVVALSFLDQGLAALERWLRSDPGEFAQRFATIAALFAGSITAPLIAFAALLWIRGTRIRRERRVPLQGERVIRDTPILAGDAAEARGRLLQGFAIGFALCAGLLAIALWRLTAVSGIRVA